MSTGTPNSASSSNSNGPAASSGGVNFHHLSRNQLEKIINMRINALTCHDIKCKREKEHFQRVISKMADTFSELFAQVEKQRRDLQEIVRLHNKICNEFAIPNQIKNQNETDYQKLKHIATMFQDFFAKHTKSSAVKVEIETSSSSNIVAKHKFPPTQMAMAPGTSGTSNITANAEMARKRKLTGTGNASTNAVTIQSPNKFIEHSSINTLSTAQIRTPTPSSSAFGQVQQHQKSQFISPTRANASNGHGLDIGKYQMSSLVNNMCPQNQEQGPTGRGNQANNFVSSQNIKSNGIVNGMNGLNMAASPTVSALIFPGQELSFAMSNAPKKPRFATPMPKMTITKNNQSPNEADIIQIDD